MNWLQKHNMGLWEDIEESGPESVSNDFSENYKARENFSRNFGWAVPTKEAVEKLHSFIGGDQVLEAGAGKGVWAKLMQDAGIDIIPTDIHSGVQQGSEEDMKSQVHPENHYWRKEVMEDMNPDISRDTYTPIYRMDAEESLRQFGSANVLMMVWPPYDDPMAANALRVFKGSKLIYIGEGSGGCTGDDCFHDILWKEWQEVDIVCIPQWQGIHDCLYLYTRK